MKSELKWLGRLVGLAVAIGALPVLAEKGAKPGGRAGWEELRGVMMQIRQKEQQLLREDPELKTDIDALEKQRQEKFTEKDPELAELYGKRAELQQQARARKGGKDGKGGGRKGGKGKGAAKGGGGDAEE